jgi:predicted nucleotidyltransferase
MKAPAQPVDGHAIDAAREFARRVSTRYPVHRCILFGSRARGTHRPESDVDVAVLLKGPPGKFLATKIHMVDDAFDVLLETGVYIQPLPIWEEQWKRPKDHSNPRLLENIEREGIEL